MGSRKLSIFAVTGLLSFAAGAQQTTTPGTDDPFANAQPRSFIAGTEIASRIKQAEAASKEGVRAPADVLLKAGPTMAVMSYRDKPADHAEVHETEDELFVVIEGAGSLTMGGRLIDATRNGTTLSSAKTSGGKVYPLKKGDMVLVPINTPHQLTHIDGTSIVLLSVHILRPKQ